MVPYKQSSHFKGTCCLDDMMKSFFFSNRNQQNNLKDLESFLKTVF